MEEFDRHLSVMPELRSITVPECGHMHHDQPERLAREIKAFLR